MMPALIALLVVTPVLYALAFHFACERQKLRSAAGDANAPPRKAVALNELVHGYRELLADAGRRLGLQGSKIAAAEQRFASANTRLSPHDDLAAKLCEVLEQNRRLHHDLELARRQLDERHNELERAKAESRIDHLTQLPNRRAFEEKLAEAQARFERHLEGYALAVFDVDRFKAFNDTHGHVVGDAMLKTIGKTACAVRRSTDFLARIGGEEFAILFPRLTLAQAETAVERFRKAIATTKLRTGGRHLNVTVSFGIAVVASGETPGEVLARADEALYRAKAAGRNQTCVHEGNTSATPVEALAPAGA